MVFAPSFPYPTVFFASVKEIASRHRELLSYGRKAINVSFVEFKGQETFFVREWLRQKGLENLCEMFEIFRVLYDEYDN